jgi:hypothetical protein
MEMPNLTPPEILKGETPRSINKALIIPLVVLIIGLGIGSGYFFAGRNRVEPTEGGTGIVSESAIVKGAEFGFKDESTFKDTATGIVEAGGIDTEGTHKLVREGGASQTVYLISSVLDLDQFVDKKVQVWGETNKAQKAGWLMDVGKVKILE